MKRGKINFIYEVQIIDYWNIWEPLFNEPKTIGSPREIKPITSEVFAFIVDFFYKLSDKGWEGDIRGGTAIYMTLINDDGFCIGIKQDNNGVTYIGSEQELYKEDFDYLLDEKESYFELIYKNEK